MQNKQYPKEEVISILKEWASPVLIGIVGMLLWRDVTEMRADVKLLLTQQSADRVKIEQLETDVQMLKAYIFEGRGNKSQGGNNDLPPGDRSIDAAILNSRQDDLQDQPKKRR